MEGNNMDISMEEVNTVVTSLGEWIKDHDDNRIRIQEEVGKTLAELRSQLDTLENNINDKLRDNFEEGDAQAQEVLSNLLNFTNFDEQQQNDEQKKQLAQLIARAKAFLLVEQSYDLKKPKKKKVMKNKALHNPNFGGGGGGVFGAPNRMYNDGRVFGLIPRGGFMNGIGGGGDGDDDDDKEENIDLSKIYELNIKSTVKIGELKLKKPEKLKVVKTKTGRIYLSFSKSLNMEEEKIFSAHKFLKNVVYKAAICQEGSDKWKEKRITFTNDGECYFVPGLLTDTTYSVKVISEFEKLRSDWSDCTTFTTSFSEFCGWKKNVSDDQINDDDYGEENDRSKQYFISKENPMIVKGNISIGEVMILSNCAIPQNKVTSWKFRIVDRPNALTSLLLGVGRFYDDDDDDDDGNNMNQFDNRNTEFFGWFLDCAKSCPCAKSRYRQVFPKELAWNGRSLSAGDVVGVVMNTIKGEVSFSVNGVNLGIVFDEIPLDKPLVPYVILHDKTSVELDLSEVKETVESAIPVPSGIKLKDVKWNSITLSWDVIDDISFCQVEMKGEKIWSSTANNSLRFEKLDPDTEYCFRVRVIRDDHVGEWSEIVKVRTAAIPDFSECIWNTNHINSNYKIDVKNPRKIRCDYCNISDNVTCNVMLQPNKVTSWSIKVHSLCNIDDINNGGRYIFCVGVAPFYYEESFDHFDHRNEFSGWYLDCFNSVLNSGPPHNTLDKAYGPRKKIGEYVQAGDSVGVVMDMTKGELSFVIDGMNLGVAFDGIPIDKPLAASLVLCCPNASVELDPTEVKLNTVNSSIPAPKNIVVKGKTWNSITLAWDAVDGISLYHVVMDGKDMWSKAATNNYFMDKLPLGSEHSFRVRSVRRNEVSEWSDAIIGKTEESYPDFSSSVWSNPGKSTLYLVDDSNKRIVTKNSGGMQCRVLANVPLPKNSVVSWSIKVLSVKENVTSNFIGISFCDSEIFYKPTSENMECKYFAITPDTPAGIKEFILKKKQIPIYGFQDISCLHDGDVVGVVVDTTNGTISFYLNGVNLGLTYDGIPLDKPLVPSILLGNEGDSFELDPSEVKENVDSSIPVPSNITTKSVAWDSIILAWDPVKDASFYQVEADGIIREIVSTNTFLEKNLSADSEHSFRVRTVNSNAVSEWSAVFKVRTSGTPDFLHCVWKEFYDGNDSIHKYSLSQDNPRIVTKTGGMSQMYYTESMLSPVIGSAPLPPNSISSWNIKLLRAKNQNQVFIGVIPFDVKYVHIPRCNWFIECDFLMFGSEKEHHPSVPWELSDPNLTEGDAITVIVDTAKGHLSFVVNGVNIGVVTERIPTDKPLVPCVLLMNKDDSVELDFSKVQENMDKSLSVPSNVVVKDVSCDSVKVAWDKAVGDDIFYQIECNGKIMKVIRENTFTINSLFGSVELSIRVRVVKPRAVGKWSEVVKAKTLAAPDFSACVWKECLDTSEGTYSLDANNQRIVTKTSTNKQNLAVAIKGGLYVFGSVPIPLNKVTSWNVKILKSVNNNGSRISVGVSQLGDELVYWKFDCLESTIYENYSGKSMKNEVKRYGPRKEEGQYVHTGDSIGVVMDTTRRELSFVLDGVNCGVAFKGIPLDKPLVPCVSFMHDGDSAELVV